MKLPVTYKIEDKDGKARGGGRRGNGGLHGGFPFKRINQMNRVNRQSGFQCRATANGAKSP